MDFLLAHHAALMLLLINLRELLHCHELSVDPPENLAILDPGHLGNLEITWSPPASLINKADCTKLFQLEYFDTYKKTWTTIRTIRRTYTAQFDLTKDVKVRVYTLVNGPCSNDTLVMSKHFTEVVQKPASTGLVGTAAEDFSCVFHNMEFTKCSWKKSLKLPANSKQTLYYWHDQMEQTQECPKYSFSDGVRSGCIFKSLPDFTDINFCVNGSSPDGPLKPAYLSMQIQNHVKPGNTEKLQLQKGPEASMELHWDYPAGSIRKQCLEWEVEHSQEGPDGRISLILTKKTTVALPSVHGNWRSCFRVRSRLHKYCVEKSLWSDWSHQICHPEEKLAPAEPTIAAVYVITAVAIITVLVLVLLLCVCAVLKARKLKQRKKKLDSITSLFSRKS